MMNKAINHLVTSMIDSLTKFKNKLAYYLAIFAMVFGSTFGTFNAANAGNLTKTATAAITASEITNIGADDLILQKSDTAAAVATIAFTGPNISDIILGKNDSVIQNSTVLFTPGATALTFSANIKGIDSTSNDNNNIAFTTSVQGAAAQLVTIGGDISNGGDANGLIDTMKIGTASLAGNALFTGDVAVAAITIFGGDHAAEDSVADFRKDLAATSVLLQDATGASKVIFSATTAEEIVGTVNGGADGEGTMQVTGVDGHSFTGIIGGSNKIGTLDVDNSVIFAAAVSTNTVTVAASETAQFNAALTAGNITLADSTAILKVIGNVTVAGAVTSGTINTTTAVSTFSGAIGTAVLKTKIDADIGTIFSAAVNASTILIADAKVVDFDSTVTADSITLGSSNAGGTFSATSTAAQVVTANLVSFGTDKKGIIISNNAHASGVTLAGEVGTDALSIALLTATQNTTTNGSLYAEAITVANAHGLTVKGDVEVGAGDLILSGTTGDLTLAGTTAQTITGTGAGALISGGGAGEGRIIVSNAAGATLDIIAGSGSSLNLVSLSTSGTGHVILNKVGHKINEIALATGTTLELAKTVTNGQTVITTAAAAQDEASVHADSVVIMPVNLTASQTIILFDGIKTTDAAANTAAAVADVESAVRDNAIFDYVATNAATDNITITATAKSDTTTASELSVTTSQARALQQALAAAISDTNVDSALEDIFANVINANGLSATADTDLAKQISPQADTISGSSLATRAMTGTVQGIISNRMASLRSGDAFVTGMSAGNGMSVNSGFIQAFGSEGEQKNTKSKGATVFGYDSETTGLAIGFDGMTDNGSTIGLSASYSTTDVDGKGTGKSKNSIDSYTVSAYVDKASENGYIEGSLTYGINDNTASRLVNVAGLNRDYSANYDSQQISLKVGGGVPQEVSDGAFITPFVSTTVTNISTDSYIEKSTVVGDALRLKVVQDDIKSLVGTLGVKAHMVTEKGTPMISFAINNEFGDSSISSQNTYQGGGTKFKTTTEVEDLSATLGLGFSFGNNETSLNLNYEANMNDDEYLNQYGSVKIVAKF